MSDDEVLFQQESKFKTGQETINSLRDRPLILAPVYQRNDVWSIPRRQDLIHHMLSGGYVPPLVLSKLSDGSKRCNVVDGRQRLTSIFMFLNNELPVKRRRFEDYSEPIRENFLRYHISVAEHTNLTEDEEYALFNRLQRGMALTQGEQLGGVNDPFRLQIEKWAEGQYRNLFPQRTPKQQVRKDNVRTALCAFILVAKGQILPSSNGQRTWILTNAKTHPPSLLPRCEALLKRLAELQLASSLMYDELLPLELIGLIWFLSVKKAAYMSNAEIIDKLASIHQRVFEAGLKKTNTDSIMTLCDMWEPEEAPRKRRRRY